MKVLAFWLISALAFTVLIYIFSNQYFYVLFGIDFIWLGEIGYAHDVLLNVSDVYLLHYHDDALLDEVHEVPNVACVFCSGCI